MHANIQYFIGNLLHFGNCTWVERKSSQEDGEVFTRSTNRCRIQYWLNSSDYETFQRRWMDLLDCIGPTKSSERYNPNYGVFRLAFLYGPAWFIICFLAVVMAIIYVSVLKQEKKLDKYMTNLSQKKRNNSRKIRNQAFLYVGCMVSSMIQVIPRVCAFPLPCMSSNSNSFACA